MSRYRLLPTAEQAVVLAEHCRHARYVWNLAVEQQLHWQPGRRAPGYNEQCAQLTAARADHDWLAAGSQTVRPVPDGVKSYRITCDQAGRWHIAAYTSQRSAVCGHTVPGNRKSQAGFECQACNAGPCNADVNAARNIAAGRAVTARGDLGTSRSANREPQLCSPT